MECSKGKISSTASYHQTWGDEDRNQEEKQEQEQEGGRNRLRPPKPWRRREEKEELRSRLINYFLQTRMGKWTWCWATVLD